MCFTLNSAPVLNVAALRTLDPITAALAQAVLDMIEQYVQQLMIHGTATMPRIPLTITMLNSMNRSDLLTVLKAALLRLKLDDDEASLMVTDEEIMQADRYSLTTTVIPEEGAVILSVTPKR